MGSGINDAEQIVLSVLDGQGAAVATPVVPKSITFTIADGATDFDINDTITITISKNPTATVVAAATGNVGNGACTVGAIVGDCPDEVLTLKCIAEAANAGTFTVQGSKSGKHANATVAVAYTLVYQQIEAEDTVISANYFVDAGNAHPDPQATSTITVHSGHVHFSANLNAGDVHLLWIDRSAG